VSKTPAASNVALRLGALMAGTASVVCLVFPWVRFGTRSRSSIDLIGSAGALGVIAGTTRVIVVLLWLVLPMLVAAAMVALAAQRPRLMASLLLPLGPVIGLVIGVLALVAPTTVVWGAWLSAGFAILASLAAVAVLVDWSLKSRTAGSPR